MPSKKLRPVPKSERDTLYEALLGPDEEMNDEEAAEILAAYGIDSSDTLSEFKSRVEAEARKLKSEGKSVPVPMENALKNIQSAIAAPHKQDHMDVDPNAHIDSLLSGRAKAASGTASRVSLRGRKSGERVSKKDKALIDSLKSDVDKKAKQ